MYIVFFCTYICDYIANILLKERVDPMGTPPACNISATCSNTSPLSQPSFKWTPLPPFMPTVVAFNLSEAPKKTKKTL